MEFQTMERSRPLSRFMLGVVLLIQMASTVLLCQNTAAMCWTVVLWSFFRTWTAIPFLGTPLFTAYLCLLSLTFTVFFNVL